MQAIGTSAHLRPLSRARQPGHRGQWWPLCSRLQGAVCPSCALRAFQLPPGPAPTPCQQHSHPRVRGPETCQRSKTTSDCNCSRGPVYGQRKLTCARLRAPCASGKAPCVLSASKAVLETQKDFLEYCGNSVWCPVRAGLIGGPLPKLYVCPAPAPGVSKCCNTGYQL